MFEHLAPFRVILVTGPQRSGTRFAAQAIAQSLGRVFVDERVIHIDSRYSLTIFLRHTSVSVVVQCPALCHCIHQFAQNDQTAVVMMRREVKDIVASQERIGWEWEDLELQNFEDCIGYVGATIAQTKYTYWDCYQRHVIPHAFDLQYLSLRDHPLWVEKDQRADFGSLQTAVKVERGSEKC